MPLTFDQHAQRTASEKVILAWIGAAQRLMVWDDLGSGLFAKVVPEFVVGLMEDGVALDQVADIIDLTTDGQWCFVAEEKTVYFYMPGGATPDESFVRADYRIFVSNAPYELPWDLDGGVDVEYLPIIQATSDFPYEIDPDQLGVSLEGQGSISLENHDGYFDARFEKYWWENKDITLWAWSPDIAMSQKQKLYRGILAAKAFSSQGVSFALKDFIAKLNNYVGLELFDGSEGDVQTSIIGTPKRRLYGRVAGLQVVGLDHVLNGYDLTGTISGVGQDTTLTGTGTFFLDELAPEDQLSVGENSYKVKQVVSDTQIIISSPLEENLAASTPKVKPKRPWRKKNREWLIAAHALKNIRTQIATVVQANRLTVVDGTEFEAGDQILVHNTKATIRRKSGNLLVLEQNLGSLPTVGQYVSKYPVQAVNVGTQDFIFIRDFTVDNQVGSATLVIDDLAEFNVTRPSAVAGTMTFTNGQRTVTGTGTQFLTQLEGRDWVRLDMGNWYEILTIVSDTQLVIRTTFAESTATSTGERKNVSVLTDASIVTVDCFGKTFDGTPDGDWIKTGPDAVIDLLTEAGLEDDLDTASFQEATEESEQLISLKIPVDYGSRTIPSIKDSIDIINQTVMGAIHFNNAFEIQYNVLNSKKPPALVALGEHDILGWEIQSRTDHIVGEFICRYRHLDADRFTGEESASYQSRVNEVAVRLSDARATRELDAYLYDESDAQRTAQRYALYNESASSRIIISTKINLSTKLLADKVYVDLDRLFYRIGSNSSRKKIGIIVKISKSGLNTTLEVEDLSGIWNKVCTIAPNDANEFSAATEDERVRNGYLTDPSGIVDSNDWTYRTNLIG